LKDNLIHCARICKTSFSPDKGRYVIRRNPGKPTFQEIIPDSSSFPLEIYLVAGDILEIPSGFYHYISDEHALKLIHDRDLR
jgi:cupin superfamily acireductone dioxygenase involved in methionine salvage